MNQAENINIKKYSYMGMVDTYKTFQNVIILCSISLALGSELLSIILHSYTFIVLAGVNIFSIAVCIVCIYSRQRKLQLYKLDVLWFVFALISALYSRRLWNAELRALYYSLAIIIIVIIGDGTHWFNILIKGIRIFAVIHAFATILFFFLPDIFASAKPAIIAMTDNSQFITGYKSGITGHYSTNGTYLAIGLMAVAANILGVGNNRKKKLQFLKVAEFAIILFALLLTTKRAHLLFTALAVLIVYCIVYASFRKILQLAPIIAVFIIVFTIIAKYIPETMQTLNRFINQSDITSGRTLLWEIAWNTFKENPVIGIGWGGYPYLLSTKIIAGSTYGVSYYAVNYMGAHNVYLQLLCEIGILGFTFVMFILATTFIKTFKTAIYVRKNAIAVTSAERQALTFSLMLQMFFFLYCITGNPLYDRMVYIPYFLCCAVGMAMDKKYLRTQRHGMKLFRRNRVNTLMPKDI